MIMFCTACKNLGYLPGKSERPCQVCLKREGTQHARVAALVSTHWSLCETQRDHHSIEHCLCDCAVEWTHAARKLEDMTDDRDVVIG